jgi:hypothetical protein
MLATPLGPSSVGSLVISPSFHKKSLSFTYELLRALGPGERITGLVIVGEEAVEEFFEIRLRPLRTVRQALLAENTEEAFDEIQPGGMGRSVVKPNLRMIGGQLHSYECSGYRLPRVARAWDRLAQPRS